MISFYIGKILYESSSEIQQFFENPDNLDMIFQTSGEGSVQTLLVKRLEFKHENEVRLIYSANDEADDITKNIYQYRFDPNDILDELLFDPRFDDGLYATKRAEFLAQGFTKTIDKSTLYHVPNFNLRLNH